MKPTSVFAFATSRLHADLIVVRLKHAGISCEKVSAVFPERLTPNSALCWLEGKTVSSAYEGEDLIAAGPLGKTLSMESEASLAHSLMRAGLRSEEAAEYAEGLTKDQILICVHSANEDEVAIAWHTLCESRAEEIAIGLSNKPIPQGKKWFSRSARRSRDENNALTSWAVAI
jgi:hypothetical protein